SGEIENDVEGSSAIGHRRRNESARSYKERGIPPMIDERRERDAHLADDLRPQLQGVAGLAPRRERQIRPYCAFTHSQRSRGLKDSASRPAKRSNEPIVALAKSRPKWLRLGEGTVGALRVLEHVGDARFLAAGEATGGEGLLGADRPLLAAGVLGMND